MGLGRSLIIKTLRFIDYKGQMGPRWSSEDGKAAIRSCRSDRDPTESGYNPPQADGRGPKFREETWKRKFLHLHIFWYASSIKMQF